MTMKLPRLLAVSALALATAAGVAAATLRQGPTQPDQMHTWMQGHVGMWDAKVTGMTGESKGTWEVKPGPGGLWLFSEFKSEMMGMPFHGMEFMGYHPAKGMFSSVWIDSMSTESAKLEGKLDEAKKTLTMSGKSVGMDGQPTEVLQVWQYADADHMSFEMKGKNPDGTEMSYMTIHYTRRKK
jgi:hypothetical protein